MRCTCDNLEKYSQKSKKLFVFALQKGKNDT